MSGPITPSLRERITPFRVAAGLVVALVVAFVILLKIPSGDYLLLPDVAHPVAPLVHVAGGKPATDGGELFFVDVLQEKASEFDVLFPWLHPHSKLLPEKDLIPPGSNDAALQQAELRQMAMSQRVAAAVALRYLGYHVVVRPTGVLVNQIFLGTDAARTLQPSDVIVAVNGHPTPTVKGLRAIMAKVKPGQTVTLRVVGGKVTRTVQVTTTADKKSGRALIGIGVGQSAAITLPFKVAIDSGDIGGPSAGLAFTLEVMRLLGHDVTHGYKVAATGEINLDGTVTAIGGVEQKTWGVREAGAQVFLVPVDQGNAKTAERYAGPDLKIIPVTSLKQALAALAKLK